MSYYYPLLSKQNHPCNRLSMYRICLNAAQPYAELLTYGNEAVLYSLSGQVHAYVDGMNVGAIGGRKSVTEQQAHAIRLPAGVKSTITFTLRGFAADLLWVTCRPDGNFPTTDLPYIHRNDTFFHEVGSGSHLRTVGEVPTPRGFNISLGETLNIPGGTSSWPAHATPEDVEAFVRGETTWEEMFFVVAPKPGISVLNGVFTGGNAVLENRVMHNGSAHVMPLGSHAITAAPDAWLWYAWFYCGNALTKTYNQWSTDVSTYVK